METLALKRWSFLLKFVNSFVINDKLKHFSQNWVKNYMVIYLKMSVIVKICFQKQLNFK